MSDNFASRCFAVTGGCGFIGSHLVRRLLDLGASSVRVIDDLSFGSADNLSTDDRLHLHRIKIGPGAESELAPVLRGVNGLFHLAAKKHNQSLDRPQAMIDTNIVGTHELLSAAVNAKVQKLVFSSSLYVYGRMSGEPFVETETPSPDTVYGITKLAGEHLCRHFQHSSDLPAVCLRYMFVYGPRQYAGRGYRSVIVNTLERLLSGNPPLVRGDGKQVLDYLFVDDAVDATVRAMTLQADFEVINIGSGRGVSVLDLIDRIKQVCGRDDVPNEFGPPDVTDGSRRVGEVGKMRRLLGVEPGLSLEEGLRRTHAWVNERKTGEA